MEQEQTKNNITYDNIGFSYQKTRSADFRIVDKIVNLINTNKTKTLIDIGAGTGNYSCAMAENGFYVTAVEPSEVMISQRKNHNNLTFIKAVAEDFPFEDNSFDTAIATLSIHHFRDKKLSFEEINRVLNSTGKFVFFTFDNRIIDDKFWMSKYFADKISEAKK